MARSVQAAWLSILFAGLGCASPGSAPEPLRCAPDAEAAGAFVEITRQGGGLGQVALGPCGHLTYQDGAGDLYLAGPSLREPTRIADAVAGSQLSRRGDQLWTRASDGTSTWTDLNDASSVSLEAAATGFVRLGQGELAFACAGSTLFAVDAAGASELVDDVDTCTRVFTAPDAPVLVYVGPVGELRALNVQRREVLELGEVPFAAVRGDQVRLSRDGRILYHQPSIGSQRVGIFDLEQPAGRRLLAAPPLYGGLGSIVEAVGSGHVAALRTSEGLLVITEDVWINAYGETATLVALEPSGRHALVQYPVGPETGGWPIELADLDSATLERTVAVATSGVSNPTSSPSQEVVAFTVSSTSGWPTLQRWVWGPEPRLEALPDMGRNVRPFFVGDDGRILVVYDDDVALLSADDREVARWPLERLSRAWPLAGDATLLWVRSLDYATSRLVTIDAAGASRELLASDRLQSVMLDAAGERIATVSVEVEPADPSGFVTVVRAGAVP